MHLKPLLLMTSLTLATGIQAGEHKHDDHEHELRQHGSHVHGIASLNLVREGQALHVELDSPAANILGFEHVPSTDQDRATLEQASASLRDGDHLFRFNAEAGCRMQQVELESSLLDAAKASGADHKDHDHYGHKHEHGHEHQDQQPGAQSHADILVRYLFACDRPDQLTQLSLDLFKRFPGMEKLQVQYVGASQQSALELSAAQPVMDL